MESNAERLVKFSNVRVYLFVDMHVTIVYIVLSNQKYDLHIDRRRFPKKFSKMEPNAERLVKF